MNTTTVPDKPDTNRVSDLTMVLVQTVPDLPIVTAARIAARLHEDGYQIVRAATMAAVATAPRCDAAHAEDRSLCDGPAAAVRIIDQTDAEVTGCVRHGAALLAALELGWVYPGPDAREGDAISAYKLAQALRHGETE